MNINNDYVSNYSSRANTSMTDVNKKNANLVRYFNKLCKENPNVNLKMISDISDNRNKVTLCLSPKLVQNAASGNPKAEGIINHGIESIPDAVSLLNMGLPDGRRAKSVSFMVDANGNVSTFVDWEKPEKCKNRISLYDKDYKKILKKRKMKLDKIKQSAKKISNPYTRAAYDKVADKLNTKTLDSNI